MKGMYPFLAASMISTIIAISAVPALSAPPKNHIPKQWEKAVEYFELTALVPGTITECEEIFDHKGKLKLQTKTLCRLMPGKNGTIKVCLIKAEQDGKDITEEVRKDYAKDLKIEEISDHDPFTATRQDCVRVTCPGTQRLIRSNPCIACEYTLKTAESHLRGTAWLHRENGMPVEVDIEMIDLPKELKDADVTSLRQTNRYGRKANSPWVLQESELDMAIETSGIFSFKGKIHSKISYDEYWEYTK